MVVFGVTSVVHVVIGSTTGGMVGVDVPEVVVFLAVGIVGGIMVAIVVVGKGFHDEVHSNLSQTDVFPCR